MASYESHSFLDADFPIIFHRDRLDTLYNPFTPHWHDSLELLYFINGTGLVLSDAEQINAAQGDLVIINYNQIHMAYPTTESCEYYCLIIGKNFCESLGIRVQDIRFWQHIPSCSFQALFSGITSEMAEKPPYYRIAVKSMAGLLLVSLLRGHASQVKNGGLHPASLARMDIMREAIQYLRAHFREPVLLKDVSTTVGMSKYYFCRMFKEFTGLSLVNYVNRLRCEEAQALIVSGKCNVTESALKAGFNNLSYFTRVYRKQIGVLPSAEKAGHSA